MSCYNYVEVMIQLNDIDEIVNQILWYVHKPEVINDTNELLLYFTVHTRNDNRNQRSFRKGVDDR